jgi:hypothetical protein
MTPPKHGFYSHTFTPEEIASLDAMPPDQYLEYVKFALLILAVDLLKQPGLSARQRLQIINAVKRFIPK